MSSVYLLVYVRPKPVVEDRIQQLAAPRIPKYEQRMTIKMPTQSRFATSTSACCALWSLRGLGAPLGLKMAFRSRQRQPTSLIRQAEHHILAETS